MPEVAVDKPITLDLLDVNAPALSATSDVPVIETKPDSTPAKVEVPPVTDKTDPAAAPDKEAKTNTEDEPADTLEQPENAAASDEPKKPAKGVQKALDRLAKQAGDAERREQAAREENSRLLAIIEAQNKPKVIEAAADEPVEPKADDFADPNDYTKAMVKHAHDHGKWEAKREAKAEADAAREAQQQATIAEQTKTVQQAYAGRVEKVMEKYADYKQVAESPDVSISMAMADAIVRSDSGPEVAYFLGKNPDEAKRIAALAPSVQLMELGKIEAKLTAPTKPVSAAPAPIKPTTPAASTTDVSDEELPMEQYAAKRKKQWATARH